MRRLPAAAALHERPLLPVREHLDPFYLHPVDDEVIILLPDRH